MGTYCPGHCILINLNISCTKCEVFVGNSFSAEETQKLTVWKIFPKQPGSKAEAQGRPNKEIAIAFIFLPLLCLAKHDLQ